MSTGNKHSIWAAITALGTLMAAIASWMSFISPIGSGTATSHSTDRPNVPVERSQPMQSADSSIPVVESPSATNNNAKIQASIENDHSLQIGSETKNARQSRESSESIETKSDHNSLNFHYTPAGRE